MKSAHSIVAAALLAGLGLAAVAQQQTPPAQPRGGPGMTAHRGDGHHGRMDPAQRQERIAKRMNAFKQKLAITPAQEGAWSAWTAAMQPQAKMQRPDRAEFANLTTPERIDRMRALRTERMARMDQRGEATKAFYAALAPEQKKVFDAEGDRTMRRGGGRMGHHHRG